MQFNEEDIKMQLGLPEPKVLVCFLYQQPQYSSIPMPADRKPISFNTEVKQCPINTTVIRSNNFIQLL